MMLKEIALCIVIMPLLGAILAGMTPDKIVNRRAAHWLACSSIGVSCLLSFYVLYYLLENNLSRQEISIYDWLTIGTVKLEVGFLLDRLTAIMMCVVTFVSLMVHIYTIGYMHEDPGYKRFFSYISLFTFAMLMLVMANNLVQLFFGWEGVGLASYLLIGFWYKKESAIFANLKAFLVNRVGDFGFILGISAIFFYFNSFNYHDIFTNIKMIADKNLQLELLPGFSCSAVSVMCICLFIGAMAKSAQVPLHVWLPDSMEGPTPISALIHAATMVTAGVFMVARMSPLFEYSDTARSFILVIGAVTAMFMGLLGLVQNDIKRIIAYSTLSQLGYMVVALGASAYSIAIFHLFTHAFFKALLFLSAGSVIMAMHHEQDIWRMGNLKKYMPITYATSLLGSLALIGTPFFSGFYSKDLIIEAVKETDLAGAGFAYFAVLVSVFITALYSFRLFFVVFHTKERMDEHTKDHLAESPIVVWLPLVLLAIPSVLIGAITVGSLIFANGDTNFFRDALFVLPDHDVITKHLVHDFYGWFNMGINAVLHAPFWLALLGVVAAFVLYVLRPDYITTYLTEHSLFKFISNILQNKYWFDSFNEKILAKSTRKISSFISSKLDSSLIDRGMVDGTASSIGRIAVLVKKMQTGYLYNYTFLMVLGLLVLVMLLV